MTACLRRWLPIAVLLTSVLMAPSAKGEPIIEPGREQEVLALFAPYALGKEVTPGWRLWGVNINRSNIKVSVRGPEDRDVGFLLDHPDREQKPDARSKSFAISLSEPARAGPAKGPIDALVAAVQKNDNGRFWRIAKPLPTDARSAPQPARDLVAWGSDGILIIFAVALVLATMALRQLRDAPRWVPWALVALVVAGGALRFWLARDTAMAPWPYSRLPDHGRLVFYGPVLGAISEGRAGPLYLTDAIHSATLAFAVLAPLAIFVHAIHLHGSWGAALAAAGLLAVLPQHIRFSQSNAALVPSIVLSSVAFGLTHAVQREESRPWRLAALAVLPFASFGAVAIRPLNALFFPLLIAGTVWLSRARSHSWRWAAVAAILLGSVPALVRSFGLHSERVAEVLGWHVVTDALTVLVSPWKNTLLNPTITPPLVLVAAVAGGVLLWKRGPRRTVVFLVVWLLAFLITHAVVVPKEAAMQARYHLHLVAPLLLLAAAAVEPLYARSRKGFAVGVGAVALSPLIHLSFVRDVSYNDMNEYEFLKTVRNEIPNGCTVVEYAGSLKQPRLPRIGEHVERGLHRLRYVAVSVNPEEAGDSSAQSVIQRVASESPECLMYFEGLPCWGDKPVEESIAPACARIRRSFQLEPVREIEFDNRPYDHALARGFSADQDRLTVSLHRLRVGRPEGER